MRPIDIRGPVSAGLAADGEEDGYRFPIPRVIGGGKRGCEFLEEFEGTRGVRGVDQEDYVRARGCYY